MADFDNGYPDVTSLQGRELFLLYDPLFREGLNITVDNYVAQYGVNEISDVPGLVADLAAKQTQINTNTTKLAGIENGADVTDGTNVRAALGISGSGSRDLYLSQQGTFELAGSDVEITKAAVDLAIGATPSGDSAQFYNQQGNFIDAVYDSIEDTPVTRNATVETITINGTRTNVQVQNSGTSEFSTITMLDSFNPVPTQYTTTFTSPNTTITPVITLPAGSQGTQFSLTETDGTVHRFCYLVNGNYRYLDGGLSGTIRKGTAQQTTTATSTGTFAILDQTADQTVTLAGDETGTFAVGDFISPQANNFGAFRGIFVDSITFDGTNTVIVGLSNGSTTFTTASTIYRAGPADEIQGTLSSFSVDPDTADAVYSSSITSQAFTNVTTNTSNGTWNGATTLLDASGNITGDSTFYDNVVNTLGTGSTITWVTGTTTITMYGLSTTSPGTVTFTAYTSSASPGTTFPASDLFGVIGASFIRGINYHIITPTPSTAYITQVANAITSLETAVTQVGGITTTTSNGLPAVSVLIDWQTETNIDSSFTITGGLNNMNTIVNTDGVPGVGVTVATTVTVIDPEATEVASQTFGVGDANDNNVDAVGNFINDAVNNNTETPIDFVSEYGSGVLTLIAQEAGNTNPWTIVFNNNGATAANQGNLSTSTVQTGSIINEMEVLSVPQIHGVNGEIEITSQVGTSGVRVEPSADSSEPETNVTGTITVLGAATTVSLRLLAEVSLSGGTNGYEISLTVDGVTTSKSVNSAPVGPLDDSVSVLLDVGTHTYTAVVSRDSNSNIFTGSVSLRGGNQNLRPSSITLEEGVATINADTTLISSSNGIEVDRIVRRGAGPDFEDSYIRFFSFATAETISIASDRIFIEGQQENDSTVIGHRQNFIEFYEEGTFVNSGGRDADFTIFGSFSNFPNFPFKYDFGDNSIVMNVDEFTVNCDNIGGSLPPAIPTTDGEYKLVIASGVATWEII